MLNKRYSRLAQVESKKNIKSAYFYIFLSIITLIILVVFGIPLLVKFAGFIGDIAKSDKVVEVEDITPPAPPQFDELPEYTNKETLNISGKSESGATVSIRSNNHVSEVVANSDGVFSFVFNLLKGENSIDAKAIDTSGNESTQTQTFKIMQDSDEPILEIVTPEDGTSFYGSSQRQLTIKGNVSEKVQLTINGRYIAVKENGTFSYSTTLSEGENTFEVKVIDPAGNETSTSFTANFSL